MRVLKHVALMAVAIPVGMVAKLLLDHTPLDDAERNGWRNY